MIFSKILLLQQLFFSIGRLPEYCNSSIIKYTLSNNAPVTLTVFTISGKKLSTLVDSYKQAGEHSVSWNSKRYSSGVYYLKLTAGGNSVINRINIIN
ncbi:MAG: T9SS type A sorting domain-containing protein [PVC group bacterium]|nr:T9SS type A sorting domain-containing protein [PVC group bacterium]